MYMKTAISTQTAPAAIGPYSQAIRTDEGRTVFVSGQLPLDPVTGRFSGETAADQTKQSLINIEGILAASGTDMAHVVKVTVFLCDMEDFDAMNQVYARYFTKPYPARVAVEVAKLPKNARVEIEAVAQF